MARRSSVDIGLDSGHIAESDSGCCRVRQRTRSHQSKCSSRSRKRRQPLGAGRLRVSARSLPPVSIVRRQHDARRAKAKFSRKTSSRVSWHTEKAVQIQNARGACSDRSPHRCRAHSRHKLFRVPRVVSLARYLLEQIATHRKESACSDRLGVGCSFLERLRAISRSTRACAHHRLKPARRRGIAINFPIQAKGTIEEPVELT